MSTVNNLPEVSTVWEWLSAVPDPEIPVISIVDLGIVRGLNWNGGCLEVVITPTYSGCPATSVINFDISEALRANGIDNFKLKTQIAPPWTTEWISDAGKNKLKSYGIAPPVDGASCSGMLVQKDSIRCPRCDSNNTKCVSQFGSTPCKAAYQCSNCLEPFDYFKHF